MVLVTYARDRRPSGPDPPPVFGQNFALRRRGPAGLDVRARPPRPRPRRFPARGPRARRQGSARPDPRRRPGGPGLRVRAGESSATTARCSRRATGPAAATGPCGAAPRRPSSAIRAKPARLTTDCSLTPAPCGCRITTRPRWIICREFALPLVPFPAFQRGGVRPRRRPPADAHPGNQRRPARPRRRRAARQGGAQGPALSAPLTAEDREKFIEYLRDEGPVGQVVRLSVPRRHLGRPDVSRSPARLHDFRPAPTAGPGSRRCRSSSSG